MVCVAVPASPSDLSSAVDTPDVCIAIELPTIARPVTEPTPATTAINLPAEVTATAESGKSDSDSGSIHSGGRTSVSMTTVRCCRCRIASHPLHPLSQRTSGLPRPHWARTCCPRWVLL